MRRIANGSLLIEKRKAYCVFHFEALIRCLHKDSMKRGSVGRTWLLSLIGGSTEGGGGTNFQMLNLLNKDK